MASLEYIWKVAQYAAVTDFLWLRRMNLLPDHPRKRSKVCSHVMQRVNCDYFKPGSD